MHEERVKANSFDRPFLLDRDFSSTNILATQLERLCLITDPDRSSYFAMHFTRANLGFKFYHEME